MVEQPIPPIHLPTPITAHPTRTTSTQFPHRESRLTTNAATVDPTSTSVTSEIDYWRDYSVVGMLADWGIRMHMGCCSAGSISFFYWVSRWHC